MQMPNILPMLLPAMLPTEKPKRLAEQIRDAYPNPITRSENITENKGKWTQESYCVLVAAQIFGGGPPNDWGAGVLVRLNSTLSYEQERKAIQEIYSANDRGDFERAWELLDEALEANR